MSNIRNVRPLPKNRHSLLSLFCCGSPLDIHIFCFLVPQSPVCVIRTIKHFLFHDNFSVSALNQPFPGLYVCMSLSIPYYAYTFWIPIVAFDCMLLVLALCICIRRVQSIPGLYLSRNRIWKVLLVDSLLYFSMYVTSFLFVCLILK
jgi:hypothetical protein